MEVKLKNIHNFLEAFTDFYWNKYRDKFLIAEAHFKIMSKDLEKTYEITIEGCNVTISAIPDISNYHYTIRDRSSNDKNKK